VTGSGRSSGSSPALYPFGFFGDEVRLPNLIPGAITHQLLVDLEDQKADFFGLDGSSH
jgi:hypothetical protein